MVRERRSDWKRSVGAAAAAVAAVVILNSCSGQSTPASPSAIGRSPSSPSGDLLGPNASDNIGTAAVPVSLCHKTDAIGYTLISVSSSAEPAHRGHGDASPFEAVPGQPGKFFDSSCHVVDSCPGCPITSTVTAE